MPELPEVEVVRRGLEAHASGRTVRDVDVRHPRATRRHVLGGEDFAARLRGRTLGPARRRGKFLWLPLGDSGEALVAHLGMSGQLLVVPPDSPAETHLRVRLRFDDPGPELHFVDQRTFGGLAIDEMDGDAPAAVRHIARDPLDPQFDDAAFTEALRRRRSTLKRALLDQTLVSGIGNIYADEALWRARLHGSLPTAGMSDDDLQRLLTAVRQVMTDALREGGTSFDALYVNVNGLSGGFDRSLAVYAQHGHPCPECGTPVERERFTNRYSHFCPRCQPPPSATVPTADRVGLTDRGGGAGRRAAR